MVCTSSSVPLSPISSPLAPSHSSPTKSKETPAFIKDKIALAISGAGPVSRADEQWTDTVETL